ncbi:MAG: helix-turn-helix domain-containing protein [bacterium]
MARRDRRAESEKFDQVMTVDQVAAYLQLNRLTVYRYVREGKIPAAKIGKVYRILRADVDRFLEAQKVAVPRAPERGHGSRPEPRRSAVWVRDVKRPQEISVAPSRRDRPQERDRLILSGDPLEIVVRGFH